MFALREGMIVIDSEESLENIKRKERINGEESAYKFYYCESNGKHYVGHRCDTRYYAKVMVYPNGEVVPTYGMSKHLPWGETSNGYTYPSEPKEISFQEYLTWFLKALAENRPVDKAVTLS